MHTMSNFENLSISLSNKSIQSIISNTSAKGSDNNSRKPAHKKWGHGQKQTRDNLKDNKNIVHIDDAINPCLMFSKVKLARARMAGKIRLKRIRAKEIIPILIVNLFNKNNKSVMIWALADSGTAKSLVANNSLETCQ